MAEQAGKQLNIDKIITDVLDTIEREREREIVSRRFGLFDRKETLEQIGELLGITRERVRQLEKSVVVKLKGQAGQKQLPHVEELQATLVQEIETLGKVARIQDLTGKLTNDNSRINQARVSFLAELSPELAVI
ncbi:MAG: hypothetical protein JWL85_525, partial [Candidatus Saccharibacteria bacterium]|nr:hypothetical protein [Candidatus Saccharibacteria bacterium]